MAWDYDVLLLTKQNRHYRINGRLDVWPSIKRYYDLKNRHKGSYDDLEKFVRTNYHPSRGGFINHS